MMTQPSNRSAGQGNQFGVFDFTEDENRVEKESKKLLRRFGSPGSKSSSAIDKYEFLRCFAQDTTSERKEPLCRVIDIEDKTTNEDRTQEKGQIGKLSDSSACVVDQQCLKLEFNRVNMSSDGVACEEAITDKEPLTVPICLYELLQKQRVNVISDDEGCEKCGKAIPKEGTRCNTSGYGTSDPIDVISDDFHGRTGSNSSTSISSSRDIEVSSGEEDLDSTSRAHEIDAKQLPVLIIPDFMIYGDIYCTNSKLTFSDSCIEVEGSAVNASKGTFSCQWAVEDIIKIESEWYLEVETAIVNFLIKSRNPKGAGSANETSGISLLKVAVYDPNWSVALDAIKLLDSRYKDIWFDIFAVDGESDENAFKGQICGTLLTNFTESFEDIIYPQGDPDSVLISKRDVEFLRPESFINDTIIDFYIRYLKDQIQPEEQCRFHFFNCFFFRKLANIDKGSRSTSGGREAFERVQKWTKKVDLFGKDYIFIPVNLSLHWSLIVICHPGEAIHFNDGEAQNSQRVPCILHMDSIKGSHRGLKSIFPSYLTEEWKERHGNRTSDSSRSLNLRFIPLELPQQENSYDCGLFLLHYLELFLRQAPANFNPSIISKSAGFLTRNWFPPVEASLKRGYIRELLYSLQKCHSRNSVNCKNTQPSFGVSSKVDQEKEIEIVKETCSSRKSVDGYPPIAIPVAQAETSPSAACRARVARCWKSSGELPDLILSKETLYKGGYVPQASKSQRVFMSPIQEIQEIGEKTANSPFGRHDSRRMVDNANTSGTTLFCSDDHQPVETSRGQECPLYIEDSDKEDMDSVASISESQDSSEVQLNEDDMILVAEESEEVHRTNKIQSPSTSVQMLSDCVVEDSFETESINKGDDKIKDSASSFVSIVVLSSKERGSSDNRDLVAERTDKSMAKRPKTRRFR